jgi:hypothetical protein
LQSHQGTFEVLDVNEAAAEEAVGTTPVMTPGLDKCRSLHQQDKDNKILTFPVGGKPMTGSKSK